jgi:hypothetical protein
MHGEMHGETQTFIVMQVAQQRRAASWAAVNQRFAKYH